ncbi:MAG: hypothetical protein [Bacteriophage sp.]|nr:MAG: hypothetical protein [Bacteriophage sp.]
MGFKMRNLNFDTMVAINQLVTACESGVIMKTRFTHNAIYQDIIQFSAKTSLNSYAVIDVIKKNISQLIIKVKVHNGGDDFGLFSELNNVEFTNQEQFVGAVNEWLRQPQFEREVITQDE